MVSSSCYLIDRYGQNTYYGAINYLYLGNKRLINGLPEVLLEGMISGIVEQTINVNMLRWALLYFHEDMNGVMRSFICYLGRLRD